MPRKISVQKEEIIAAGLRLIQEEGWPAVGIRSVARTAGCSTQPVISHFPTLEALRTALWQAANELQEKQLFDIDPDANFLLQIGVNYVRFALEEPKLFQAIFDSNWNEPASLSSLLADPALRPVLEAVMQESGLEENQALQVFEILSMFLHGYASLAAAGQMEADLEAFQTDLTLLFEALQDKMLSQKH